MRKTKYGANLVSPRHVFAAAVCVLFPIIGVTAGDRTGRKAEESCGPQALAAAFSMLGKEVNLSQCATLAGTDANGLTAMAGLEDAARSLGATVRGVRLTPDELGMLNRVAILHVTMPRLANHYIVFRSVKDGLFEIIDPSRTRLPQYYTREQLVLMWDGACLLFSRWPLTDLARVSVRRWSAPLVVCAAGCLGFILARLLWRRMLWGREGRPCSRSEVRLFVAGSSGLAALSCAVVMGLLIAMAVRSLCTDKHGQLLLGTSVLELGDVPRGEPIQVDTWVANIGRTSIHVKQPAIRTSCSCAKAEVQESVLPPGTKQRMRIAIGAKAKPGPFEHSIFIPSDDPSGGRVLWVKGNIVGPGVAYPPQLHFVVRGNVQNGRLKNFVYIGESPETRITRITCDVPYVRCRLLDEKPGIARFEAMLTDLPAADHFNGMITIDTSDASRAEVRIPFSGVARTLDGQVVAWPM
jgi:hypothetical protein